MNSAQTTDPDRLKVSRYNYPSQFGDDLQPLLESITGLLINGPYVLTQEVSQFEAQFAEYLGVSHARGVNSGTDALVVALLASGVGRGDEVITQANTFNATVAAICAVGAKPVLVDADEGSFLINGSQVESGHYPGLSLLFRFTFTANPPPSIAWRHRRKAWALHDRGRCSSARRAHQWACGRVLWKRCMFQFSPQ